MQCLCIISPQIAVSIKKIWQYCSLECNIDEDINNHLICAGTCHCQAQRTSIVTFTNDAVVLSKVGFSPQKIKKSLVSVISWFIQAVLQGFTPRLDGWSL